MFRGEVRRIIREGIGWGCIECVSSFYYSLLYVHLSPILTPSLKQYGANKSKLMTKTSSVGLWVPVHDEEWNGDLPLPLQDQDQDNDEKRELLRDTDCGELVFKKQTLTWTVGDYELRYHHDGKLPGRREEGRRWGSREP